MKKYNLKSPQLRTNKESIQRHIKIGDLSKLALYALLGPDVISAPKWVGIENRGGIERVVALRVPGISTQDYIPDNNDPLPQEIGPGGLESLQFFDEAWPVRASGSKERIDPGISTFTTIPFTAQEKKAFKKARQAAESESFDAKVPLDQLVLTKEQLRICGYFGKAKLRPTNSKGDEDLGDSRLLAIDCEMCETAKGKVLAKISVVDRDCKPIYETFVQPAYPVIDYLTPFSGITKELLEGVTTTLEDVQDWFVENVKPSDILVGHSLECDLNVLELSHHHIIDTALLFPHPKGLPWRNSLKFLAERYLDKKIQTGANGHDPTEDAATCMELLLLKQRKGMDYGNWPQNSTIAEKLAAEKKTTAIIDYGIPAWDQKQHAHTTISTSSDREVASHVLKQCKKHDFTWASLQELEKAVQNGLDVEAARQETNRNLGTILSGLPPRTLVILWTEHGDKTEYRRLKSKEYLYREQKKLDVVPTDPFTSEDEALLRGVTDIAKVGLGFVKVVPGDLPRELLKKHDAATAGLSSDDEPPLKLAKLGLDSENTTS